MLADRAKYKQLEKKTKFTEKEERQPENIIIRKTR